MSKYQIETELFKDEEPIDFPEEFDDDELESAVLGAKLALDRGSADKVVIYIAKNDELLEIITEDKNTFDHKKVADKIEKIKGSYEE